MEKKKKKYEPPIAYDLTHAVSDEVHAATCKSGLNATSGCLTGQADAVQCKTGDSVTVIGDCQPGSMATGSKCEGGGMATQKCKSGGIA